MQIMSLQSWLQGKSPNRERKKAEETTGQKYNGLLCSIGWP